MTDTEATAGLDLTNELHESLASAERLAASYADTAISLAINYDEHEAEVRDALMELRAGIITNRIRVSALNEYDSRVLANNAATDFAAARIDATIARLCPGAEGE
jgi:hypothetical protein